MQKDPSLTVLQEELTNRISFYIAQAAPMTKCTIDAMVKLVHSVYYVAFNYCNKYSNSRMHGYLQNQVQVSGLTDILSIIAAVCFTALGSNNGQDSQGGQKKARDYAKIMVMACVLYDQIDGEGVFVRSSKIPVLVSRVLVVQD